MKFLEFFGSSFVLCIYMAVLEVLVEALPSPIVGGETGTESQFPYQVLVGLPDDVTCGGSVISNNYVLTAAHCVIRNVSEGDFEIFATSDVHVRAGTIDYKSGGVLFDVSKIIVHPNYNNSIPGIATNDIALLKLSTPLEFTGNIQAIELADESYVVKPRTPIEVSGWGWISDEKDFPKILQFFYVNALSDEDCDRDYGPSVLCADNKRGQNICGGDSGGPAVVNGILVGVVSFGTGKCAVMGVSAFAKVSFLREWIEENSDLE